MIYFVLNLFFLSFPSLLIFFHIDSIVGFLHLGSYKKTKEPKKNQKNQPTNQKKEKKGKYSDRTLNLEYFRM